MSQKHNQAYTHFQGDNLSRVEKIERTVVNVINNSKVEDKDRIWGKVFEIKHCSSCIQLGRLLAQKRGLDEELCVVICALHDIYVSKTGMSTDHAVRGVPVAKEILDENGGFTDEGIQIILNGVGKHSEKHIISEDPYVEFIKDIDSLDCSLYEGVHDAYVAEKSEEIVKTYFARIKRMREEFGLPYEEQWDNFEYLKEPVK